MPDTAPVKWLPWKMLVGRSSTPFPTARVIVESGARHIEVVEDLFAPDVTDVQRDRAFALMGMCQKLTFRVATAFPAAASTYLRTLGRHHQEDRVSLILKSMPGEPSFFYDLGDKGWFIPNVWLLLRASTQTDLDQGVPELLETPAAVRGVLLDGPVEKVDLHKVGPLGSRGHNCLFQINGVRWVTLRGATGPDAKPLHPDIARSVRDQCQDAKIPFCFESWGEWSPAPQGGNAATLVHDWPNGERFFRVGQRAAVRLLDGKVWDEMPEVVHA